MIWTMARMRLAPSMRAHSSSSFGIVLKYPIMSQVEKGIRNVGYVRMSDHGGSPSRKFRMMSARGMKRSVGGTRYVAKMPGPGPPAHGNRRPASAYPATRPQKSEITARVTERNRGG